MRVPGLSAAAAVLLLAPSAALAATLRVGPSETHTTIQSAVAAAIDGDVILVDEGSFPENVIIAGFDGLTIRGRGTGTVLLPEGTGIHIQSCAAVTITNLAVSPSGGTGILVENSTGILLSRLTVTVGSPAIYLDSTGFVTISRCRFDDGSSGIVDDASTDLLIEKCVFNTIGGTAVFLSPYNVKGGASDRARVSKCLIDGASTGIHCGGDDVVIEKNDITSSGFAGIHFDSTSQPEGAVLAKNDVSGGQYGLYATLDRSTLSKNYFGVSLETEVYLDGDENLVEKNETDGGNRGFQVVGSGNTLSKNLAEGTVIGFQVLGGPGIVLSKNAVERPSSVGFWVQANGSQVLSNRVTGAGDFGFRIDSTGNTITRNSASDSATYDLYSLFPEGDNTYDRNRFETTFFGTGP